MVCVGHDGFEWNVNRIPYVSMSEGRRNTRQQIWAILFQGERHDVDTSMILFIVWFAVSFFSLCHLADLMDNLVVHQRTNYPEKWERDGRPMTPSEALSSQLEFLTSSHRFDSWTTFGWMVRGPG